MKIDNMDIYEQIGNLFYAIAADQHVKPLEVAELKMLISRDWLPRHHQKKETITTDATNLLVTMDSLQNVNASADDTFNDFARFYALHPDVFTKEVRDRILNTAAGIVKIFAADSKKKNVHFIKLKSLLNSKSMSRV